MGRNSISSLAAVLGILGLAAAGFWVFGPAWRSPIVALVEDPAQLIGPTEEARLAEYHRYLLADHDIDYRLVVQDDLADINRFAHEHYEARGIGEQSSKKRGLLLVIDPAGDRVRLEVGYGLEGVFPDAFIAYIEQRQMVPFFRVARVADGILAASELIITRIQNAKARAGFDGELWLEGSGGGGATTLAELGRGGAESREWSGEGLAAGGGPEETLKAYIGAMDQRNADPNLAIYTAETRALLKDWVVTPAQMDNVVRSYRGCRAEPARRDASGRYAVIRYPAAQRACAPWFFQREGDGWALDLTVMGRIIRFGRANSWHLASRAAHPYEFAFEDWRFDQNGFPIP